MMMDDEANAGDGVFGSDLELRQLAPPECEVRVRRADE